MAEMVVMLKGKAVISVSDIPEMRLAFKGLAMRKLSTRYTVGGSASARTQAGELLICNF